VTARRGDSWASRAIRAWLACLLLALGCSDAPRGRLLLIGVDGASPRIARPLLDAGDLPHLGALAREGVFGPLRAHFPIESPRIWTSIATGVSPERHGIVGFAHEDASGERQLYRGSDRRVPALWNIASDAGLSVAVVNWWNTYPVEKIHGAIISDHLLWTDIEGRRTLTGAARPELGAVAWPLEWNARLVDLLADETPLTDVADPFLATERFPAWVRPERLSRRYRNDAAVVRVALAVERALEPDVMLVFLPGIDRVSHVLWAAVADPADYARPMPMDSDQRAAAAAALQRYYAYTDALIGRVLERYGERDLVMVVSDHGFEAGGGLGFLTGKHASRRAVDGLIFARGPGVAVPERNRRLSVNDVTPTALAWLGLPVADDMDGRVASFLVDADPARIPSYAGARVERLEYAPSAAEQALLEELRALGYAEGGEATR
jgi:predicted AlkP superfamily pyrophosphatase or phosphodiesterase